MKPTTSETHKIGVKIVPIETWEISSYGTDYTEDKTFITYKGSKGSKLTVSMKCGIVCPCIFGA